MRNPRRVGKVASSVAAVPESPPTSLRHPSHSGILLGNSAFVNDMASLPNQRQVSIGEDTSITRQRDPPEIMSSSAHVPFDSPPLYQPMEHSSFASPIASPENATDDNPLLSRFAADNRDLIPPSMERKLHLAGYLPTDNPNLISEEHWETKYGISKLELTRLNEAFKRSEVSHNSDVY